MKRILRYSTLAKRIYYGMYFNLGNLRGRKPFIVYQMGKVGSKSVSTALRSLVPPVPVYHLHLMTEKGLNFVANKTNNRVDPLTGQFVPNIHYYEGQYLRHQLQTRFRNRQVNVITLVRDPIARCVSGFFFSGKDLAVQNFAQLKSQYANNDELIDVVRDVYLNHYTFHNAPNTWFDDEMKVIFGLDVYQTPFDKARGWQLYENNRAQLLLIRLENLNDVWQEAFNALNTGYIAPPLVRANDNTAGAEGELYRAFLKQPALPETYLNKMYTTRYAQHFYSPAEIEAYRSKWQVGQSQPIATKNETSVK